jgi:inositol phosphorylceramide synthase catalytic subunit
MRFGKHPVKDLWMQVDAEVEVSPMVPASSIGSKISSSFREWPVWWSELSLTRKIGPALFVVLYLASLSLLHGLRSDHVSTCVIILALYYGGRVVEPLRKFILPLLATAIVYDSQRFYSDYIRGPVHVTEPYWFDKTFFGIHTAQGILTPNEWWQIHTYPALDVICGFMYLAFIGIYTLYSAYFSFYLSRKGTSKTSAAQIAKRAPSLMWGFFWLNVVGYTTYYWYAAAPPWYVAEYGLGPANMSVRPSQAGCVRFDHVLGTHFFSEMYGRSADVFGAIPSLHVAYPFMAAIFAFKFGAGRTFAICFYLLMCFSAVYLNHHYILDILWGSSYALIVSFVVDRYFTRRPTLATQRA